MKPGDRVLITGASGGIGGAIALACAARGAWPVVAYCSGAERASALVARCGRGEARRMDLAADLDGAPAVEAIVHCAAAYEAEPSLLDAPDELIAHLLAVNLLGPLRLTRAVDAATTALKRVVFILSSASFCRGTGPYALSKASELALCRLLANELAPRGTRVDAIVPGWTATPMAERAAQAKGRCLDDIARQHPDGLLLAPQDIGELCAALLFDHADAPPGNLIEWDRRDSADPVWRPLDKMHSAVEVVSGGSSFAN
ncbi:MAG TPA: SDR family oxidoreductase [Pirellulales bacterium]|nr:SDR family oxidoreductase [Pirellulales bacterium]